MAAGWGVHRRGLQRLVVVVFCVAAVVEAVDDAGDPRSGDGMIYRHASPKPK